MEEEDVDGGILIAVVDSGLLILLANAAEEGGRADGDGLSAMVAMTVYACWVAKVSSGCPVGWCLLLMVLMADG